MKIIVYSDVHGNKYALEELTKTDDYKTADKRIFLGDSVSFCAYPNECIEILKKSNDEILMGNHDVYCAFGIDEEEKKNFNKEFLVHLQYIRNITKDENKKYLKTLNYNISFEKFGKKFYFTHYLWNDKKTVVSNPDGNNKPSTLTADLFDVQIDADYILFGHNHTPSIIEKNNKHFICVGSLGVRSPGNYIILDIQENFVKIEPKQIEYDSKRLIEEMKQINYPSVNHIVNFFSE